MRFFIMVLASVMLLSCAHAPKKDDDLGYLEQPKELKGLWQNGPQYEFAIEFTSPSHFRGFYIDTNHSDEYGQFKVFHITDDGLVYALQKRVWNPYYFDKDVPYREMTKAEIAQAEANYSYVIFDMSQETSYRAPEGTEGRTMRYFQWICELDLQRQGITLSEADFTRPASEHWERVRPSGECKYSGWFGGSEVQRPPSSISTPYGYHKGTIEELQKEMRAFETD